MPRDKTKWAVWFPETRTYIGDGRGSVQWSFDRALMKSIADDVGGVLIDTNTLLASPTNGEARVCGGCGEIVKRRRRCHHCTLMVCGWCWDHVHRCEPGHAKDDCWDAP